MSEPSIQSMFEQALKHHQTGRLPDAERLYRQILVEQPEHAGALHYLGVIASQAGQLDASIDLIRRAVALNPDYAEAYSNLGNVLRDKGRFDEAIAAHRRALALKGDFAQGYCNLANALRDTGQIDEAIAACRTAIALNPKFPEAYINLGDALKDKGQFDEALASSEAAIALRPNYARAYSNLGNVLRKVGKLDQAQAACQKAIALDPKFAEAHNILGGILADSRRLDEAMAEYRLAIFHNPGFAEARNNLGNALKDTGQTDQAIIAHREAISLRPTVPMFHMSLGVALQEKGQLDQAIAAYRQAISLDANFAEAHNNLGNALKENGQLDQAIAACRHALKIRPGYAQAHSNLAYFLHFHPGYDAQTIAEELRRWDFQHARPLQEFIRPHANELETDRRLRIGYVSADFKEHPAGRSLLPLIRQHDRRQFAITCYAQVLRRDEMTTQFRQCADAWRDIVYLSDEQVADQIRQDRIDILVDLAVHTAGNRLLVFARKPAPVQITYLGYCGSTGMSTVDHRLSDPYMDPDNADLSCYAEKTVRLPQSYWCYQPASAATPSPAPSPILKNGFVTFGCLNNFAKASAATLDLWAKILAAIPSARMILHAPPGEHRKDVLQRLLGGAFAGDRLSFAGGKPWTGYMQTYGQIDIALDPFPHGGGITTCDALWMGVPVISLSGNTAVGRGGRSILSNLGLKEFIAFTPDQYLQIATNLAQDQERLQGLRRDMRARMLASPVMDIEGFARDIEAIYRQAWRTWLETASPAR